MGFQLDLSVCQSQDCDTLEICDITCDHNPGKPFECCDGYGYSTNPTRYDVATTQFFFEFPDGVCIQKDIGFLPARSARKEVIITGGTTGGVIVTVDNVIIATALFTSDIQTLVTEIVSQINAGITSPDYYAIATGTDRFMIYAVDTGTSSNGLQVMLWPDASSDITYGFVTAGDTLAEGAGDDCTELTIASLFNDCEVDENYSNAYPDGVYTIVYTIFNSAGQEIGRVKKKLLFDCQTRNCLKELIMLSLGKCNCDPDDIQERIIMIRSRLEAAQWEFEDGSYDCANDTIKDACKRCRDGCLDC